MIVLSFRRRLGSMWIPAFTGMTLLLSLIAHLACAESSEPAPLAPQSLLTDVAAAGDALVAVGERGHVLRSADAGKSWQQVIVPTRALLTAVTFVDAQHGWAIGQNAIILATTDGGSNWTQQYETHDLPEDDGARDAPLLGIACIDASTCMASGAYGLLLKTTDGGAHWQRLYVKEDDRNFYAVRMLDAQHVILAGESGAFMQSVDGGNEWTAGSVPYDGSFFGFLALPDNSWLLYGLRGHVFRSADSGTSWQEISTGVDNGLMGGRVLADGRVVLVGAGGVVLTSTDNGQSFTLERQSNRAALAAVAAVPSGLLLFGEKGVMPSEVMHEK